jgi:hypothetical protein
MNNGEQRLGMLFLLGDELFDCCDLDSNSFALFISPPAIFVLQV